MKDIKIGVIEERFANIIWENEPLTSKELIKLCEEQLNWKSTTSYTVLKKLCDKGIFKNEHSVVTSIINKEEFYAIQSKQFVEETFDGSLPAFVTAFTKKTTLSADEIDELEKIIKRMKRS